MGTMTNIQRTTRTAWKFIIVVEKQVLRLLTTLNSSSSSSNNNNNSSSTRRNLSSVTGFDLKTATHHKPHKSERHKHGHELSYVHGESLTPLIGATIGQLLEQTTARIPDKEAVVILHQNVRLTFQQLIQQSDKLAAGLFALGLKRGDRVGILAPNCIEWILVQYATARAGIIMVNINPAYQVLELEYVLRRVGVKCLIMAERFKTQDYYNIMCRICLDLENNNSSQKIQCTALPELERLVIISDKQLPGALRFSDVMDAATNELLTHVHDQQHRLQFDDPINIQFTSGTTGKPKGALLTHHNIVNNAMFTGTRVEYNINDSIVCLPVPLYHCFGMVMGSLQMPVWGATCVFPSPSFDPDAALRAVQQERCTSLYGTPTMFIDMLNLPNFEDFDLTSLYTGIMAGSPCPVEVMKKVISRLKMHKVTVCYGTTENSPVTFQSLNDDTLDKRVSTVGKVHPHVEAKVTDDEGNIVAVGQKGELCIRGYSVMLGYWDDPEQTRKVLGPDRWYKTGDLAIMEDDGYLRIVGRIKDMVIRGGENIYPLEIEQFLYKHPKITDVQVIGVPDERLGEQVAAWIRLKEGETCSKQDIIDFCKGQIAHYKVPYYISFVDSFPLTVSGKVQKYKMREMAMKMYRLHK